MRLYDPTYKPWIRRGEKDIVALMSGGVDSSVAALVLAEQGWNVVGVTMKIPYAEGCDARRSCCGSEAAHICRSLGIAHYFLDVDEEFRDRVIERFRRWYEQGLTPSPCVDCNTDLKFGMVWDHLEQTLGTKYLATGHYADVRFEDGRAYLGRARDRRRDQSYFLYGIRADRLPFLRLPVGSESKEHVRRLAQGLAMSVAGREDSMELCFAGQGDYRQALGPDAFKRGQILDTEGNALGAHEGIANFTVGQRRGIGLWAREPLYVASIRPADNSIIVAPKSRLFTDTVRAREINALQEDSIGLGNRLCGKIRSQGKPLPCTILESGKDMIQVKFDEPVFAPTPGQRLVLYDERDRVAAGGVICAQEQD